MPDKFTTPIDITWCQRCGNFGIFASLKQAFSELGWEPSDALLVYGIGCHGHMVNYLTTFGVQGLHGRTLPVAQGAKLANKNLNVIAVAGDGDQMGEGGNHLIHASRRNIDITCVIHDNQIYGLTVGQAAPTSDKGFKSRSTPLGAIEEPIHPPVLALAAGATFVARGYAGDPKHLTKILVAGIKHKGFSVIDVLQPCVTLNPLNTFEWYNQRVYKLEETGYDPKDKLAAFVKSLEWGDKIPLGVLYQEKKPLFEDQLPQLKEKPLVERSIDNISIENLLKEFY